MLALNRKFTDSLGYTLEDIPEIVNWWPLAYPDPVYREEVRENWNRLLTSMGKDEYDMLPQIL